jgi:hypothetical protein
VPLLLSHKKRMAVGLGTLSRTMELEELELVSEPGMQTQVQTLLKERKPPLHHPPLLESNSSLERVLRTLTVALRAADSILGSAQARSWHRNGTVDVGLGMRSQTTTPPKPSRVAAWDGGVLPSCKYFSKVREAAQVIHMGTKGMCNLSDGILRCAARAYNPA